MSKMTKPTVGVVRFTESDVIVASGGIMNVTGLGNGNDTPAGDAKWSFGPISEIYSNDIAPDPSYFLSNMNDYLGTKFTSINDIVVGDSNVGTLVMNDMAETPDNPSRDASYNGTWRWNGRSFTHISQ